MGAPSLQKHEHEAAHCDRDPGPRNERAPYDPVQRRDGDERAHHKDTGRGQQEGADEGADRPEPPAVPSDPDAQEAPCQKADPCLDPEHASEVTSVKMEPMVVVYGTVCRDRVHRVARLPKPGGYVEIDEESESIGGEAVNTALALKSWGGDPVLAGNSTGTLGLDRLLQESGLDTRYLPHRDHFEPVCDIYVTPNGQRTMFGRGFKEMQDWGDPEAFPVAPRAWLTVDANHGRAGHRAVERARAAGMWTYSEDWVEDGAPKTDYWQSSTDWVAHRGDIQANVRWLEQRLELRPEFAILSDGANGFVAGGRTPDGACRPVRHYPPFPCPRLVDSTGAGDVFRAGMLYGLSQGWPLADCLRFASAAGSLNCRVLGANSGIPGVDEVHALVDAHPEIARNYD